MKRDNWEVGEHAIRPAGKPDECFYCHAPKGDQHKPECVIRSRTAVLRVSITMVKDFPESWTTQDIEDHLNEGTWCADNIIVDLDNQAERMGCLCNTASFSVDRLEASEEDEQEFKVFVKDLPS